MKMNFDDVEAADSLQGLRKTGKYIKAVIVR